jgi:hypothetical protein
MAKFDVDIKVLYNDLVVVELPENATRDEVIAAAKKKYEEEGPANTEYGEHVFDSDTWTIMRQAGLSRWRVSPVHYIQPVRSVEG